MSRSSAFLIFAVIVFLVLLRLVPAYVSGSLFSTDVWPLFRGANALLGGARLWDDRSFDGYNNHWPGVMLLAAVLSSVTGLETRAVFAYALTAWFSASLFITLYAFLRRFFPAAASAVGVLAAGLIPSFAVFTSSPLKEVMAYPMFSAFLLLVIGGGLRGVRDLFVLALLSAGMAVTHHLGSFMLAGFLVSFALVRLVYWLKGVYRVRPCVVCLLVPAAVLGAVFAAYFFTFGSTGLRLGIGASVVLNYLMYFLVIYIGFLVFAGVGRGSYLVVLVAVSAAAAVALGSYVFFLPGIAVSSSSVIWYVIPVATYLAILLPGVRDVRARVLVAGFGLFVIVNVAFVVLGEPIFAGLFHRFADYVFLPVAVLAAYWVRRGGVRGVATVGAVVLAGLSCVAVLAGLLGGWDASSYWVYWGGEVAGFSDIVALAGDSCLVGDEKVRYFAISLAEVDPGPVLKMLFLGEGPPPDSVFILYVGNYGQGFVAGLNTYDVRGLFSSGSFDRVYDNGYVEALAWGGGG